MTKINYHEYLASREWALKKKAVKERSGGVCERCGKNPHEQTHHKTYQRLGNEHLEDLLGVCRRCHEFLSGESSADPAAPTIYPSEQPVPENDWLIVEQFAKKASSIGLLPVNLESFNEQINHVIRNATAPATQFRLAQIKFEANKQFDERRRAGARRHEDTNSRRTTPATRRTSRRDSVRD